MTISRVRCRQGTMQASHIITKAKDIQNDRWQSVRTYGITITVQALCLLACTLCAPVSQGHFSLETSFENIFSIAVQAELRNDFAEAERRYEECRGLARELRSPQKEAAALHRLAIIHARTNRFAESAAMFRRAIELDPGNAVIHSDFAQLQAMASPTQLTAVQQQQLPGLVDPFATVGVQPAPVPALAVQTAPVVRPLGAGAPVASPQPQQAIRPIPNHSASNAIVATVPEPIAVPPVPVAMPSEPVAPVRDSDAGPRQLRVLSSAEPTAPANPPANSVNNPLRRLLPGGEGLIDPVADVSIVAALPSYSGVETRKIPRIDANAPPAQSPNISFTETVQAEPSPDAARPMTPLPVVRDVDVLQPSSTVIASRSLPNAGSPVARTESTPHIAHLHLEQFPPATSSTAMPSSVAPSSESSRPESVQIVSPHRNFIPANAPDVVQFVPRREEPPAEAQVAAVRQIEPGNPMLNAGEPGVRGLVRLPELAAVPLAPALAPVTIDPIPAFASVTSPVPVPMELLPDPFLANAIANPPLVAGVRQIPAAAAPVIDVLPTLIAASPPEPVASITTPLLDSLLAASEPLPMLAARPEQLPPRARPPAESPVEAPTALPQLAEARLPPRLTVPADESPRQPHISTPAPAIEREAPIGFASSRRAEQEATVAEQPPGFARSR